MLKKLNENLGRLIQEGLKMTAGIFGIIWLAQILFASQALGGF